MNPVPGRHPGRNDPCPCGSGRKYKHCCLEKDEAAARAASEEASQTAAASPANAPVPKPPKHQTHQPWKKSGGNAAFRRITTPRKVGGG